MLDVIEQPNDQQAAQIPGNVFASVEPVLEVHYALGKQFVNFFMGLEKWISRFFQQAFFKTEVRNRVIHQVIDQIADLRASMTAGSHFIQLIDVFRNSAVLLVYDFNPNVKLIRPFKFDHRYSPTLTAQYLPYSSRLRGRIVLTKANRGYPRLALNGEL
jgi:hypothetical protein